MPAMELSLLRGGVAVVTGSATGMGFAMGQKARELGMHVVLSDVREGPLKAAVQRLLNETPQAGCRVEGFFSNDLLDGCWITRGVFGVGQGVFPGVCPPQGLLFLSTCILYMRLRMRVGEYVRVYAFLSLCLFQLPFCSTY